MVRKVIVTAALTGAFHGKEANPNLPEQPDEIAQSAYECYNAGAAIVHLHARDKEGKSTNDKNVFSEINLKVRSKSPIIIQDSTAPATHPGLHVDEGLEVLDADVLPEMCSLDCTLINIVYKGMNLYYGWTREWIINAASRMKELNIKPELEVFSPTTIDDLEDHIVPSGCLVKPLSISFVLGQTMSQGAMRYDLENLLTSWRRVPTDAMFSALTVGKQQMEGTMLALLLGGNVRVGMEDNIWYRQGEKAKSNAQLVERMVRIIREIGLEVASPDEAREMLGIPSLTISGR